MQKQLFFKYVAQTSDIPVSFEIEKADGIYLFDKTGRQYIDLISGIGVNNLGHRNQEVIQAIKNQLDKYIHVMAYGEFIQSPQVNFAKMLSDNLSDKLDSVYFVNSGSESIEGALKLAKRYTGKTEIISFKNSYHGSSHGALSITGNERAKRAFRPLLPDIKFIEFNNFNDLNNITHKTACVVIEPIQGEAGVVLPKNDYLIKLRKKCDDTETLLIFDEAQTGFGRTGTLFAYEQFNVVPDILCLSKALGGSMPLGAFISSKNIMSSLKNYPVLGHITTFGGHPVCCAAGLASLKIITEKKIYKLVHYKGELFKHLLKHTKIKDVRGKGLMLAVEFENAEISNKVIRRCMKNGVITDSFLFAPNCMRIAPPLIIEEEQIKKSCEIILSSIEEI